MKWQYTLSNSLHILINTIDIESMTLSSYVTGFGSERLLSSRASSSVPTSVSTETTPSVLTPPTEKNENDDGLLIILNYFYK